MTPDFPRTEPPAARPPAAANPWAAADYSVIGSTLQIVAEHLAEAAEIQPGAEVLDVAAGSGNATLAAARRFANVTCTDLVTPLLERAAVRALAEGFDVKCRPADAEALPFADGSFDMVLSCFGAMYASDGERAAAEMLRVARHGGRIGLACWAPEGFVGQFYRVLGSHTGIDWAPALGWGGADFLRERFGAHGEVRSTRRHFNFRYASAGHFVALFRRYHGPTLRAFAALEPRGQAHLQEDLLTLLNRCNVGGRSTLRVPGEYLETVVALR
jgi:SAM-dependent methyltransferase